MRSHRFLLSALSLALLAAPMVAVQAQPAMKPGLWEVQIRNPELDAARQQMKAQLAQMPPAQRAQMEKIFQGQGAGGVLGDGPLKICHTKESLAADAGPISVDTGCTVKHSSRAATHVYDVSCRNGSVSHGEFSFAADSYRGFVETRQPGQGKMRVDQVARWLGADCGSVKPLPAAGAKR